ncbi:MAG: calcium-binding protein [Geminicoccaceae bacterium]
MSNETMQGGTTGGSGGAGSTSSGGVPSAVALTLIGTEGSDTLFGGTANDLVTGGAGADKLYGGEGDDVLEGGVGNDDLYGGAGADRFVFANGGGGDTVRFWESADRLDFSGVDNVFAMTDLVISGSTSTTVAAGDVSVTLTMVASASLAADDFVFRSRDTAVLQTGTGGADSLVGGSGDDSLDAGSGNDVVAGNYGNDILRGGAGVDSLDGGLGNDTAYGGSGNDAVAGGAGDDEVRGGNDADQLSGGDGNDAVDGESGNDVLTGGAGADRFAFDSGDGSDVITDYTEADVIDLTGIATVHGLADLVLGANGFTAGDVSITIGSAGMATLDASDILFA